MSSNKEVIPGLAGVPVAYSKISYIDGQKGILKYRGIRVEELAEKSTFEETAYLLIFGKLPNKKELEKFDYDLRHHRRLKYKIIEMVKFLPETGHPMDATQAIVAVIGMFYPTKNFYQNEEIQYEAIIRLIAKMPTLIAAYHRMRHGDMALMPRDDLNHAANFLYLLSEKEPEEDIARAFEQALILHMEHTMNASTFSARVTASTLADPFTVISSAVGTLTGPLHGGANERVVEMLREIGSVENVDRYIEEKLRKKEKIMGFGHRVYKVKDPRAKVLQKLCLKIFEKYGHSPLYDIALKVEEKMEKEVGHKGIYPNVDFYSGILYDKLGIPTDIFTPIFAMARVVGWLAHWREQLQDNRIYRPTIVYTGEEEAHYIPIEERE